MIKNMRILVTGGAGFIGSELVRHLIAQTSSEVLVIDKLTYAGNLASLRDVQNNPRFSFLQADIQEEAVVFQSFREFAPDAVMHLAAESHVDRSIDGPDAFIRTNVLGTYNLLQCSRQYWQGLAAKQQAAFRFYHISTDEVYGSLRETGLFTEDSPYDPRSPYSASKASSDHLVRAWYYTYGLPVLLTNCSNNYGPYQFPEKLIPLVLLNALERKPLPIYGKGDNIRDWLYVGDHVGAMLTVLTKGIVGRTYNIGGNNEQTNLQVVKTICNVLDALRPHPEGTYCNLITFVADRPGHDKRYAIDAGRLKNELGWKPTVTFEQGIRRTIEWYLDNDWWWRPIRDGKYAGDRLGL